MTLPKSTLIKKQNKVLTATDVIVDGTKYTCVEAVIRHDDDCGNGHNSFSITGSFYRTAHQIAYNNPEMCGCCHEDLVKVFPELVPFIKWHLTSTDEPLHYIENTLYHARDTDYNGLKKGEYGSYKLQVISDKVVKNGSVVLFTTGTIYKNNQNNSNLEKSNEKQFKALEDFENNILIAYSINTVNEEYSLSKGNEPNLQAARNSAVWPEATLEQLTDKEALKERLPALMQSFKNDVESLGLVY